MLLIGPFLQLFIYLRRHRHEHLSLLLRLAHIRCAFSHFHTVSLVSSVFFDCESCLLFAMPSLIAGMKMVSNDLMTVRSTYD